MVQDRAGFTGAPSNLGEVTATRYILRVSAHAGPALMQGDRADAIGVSVLDPLARAEVACRADRQAKAEATRVNF